MVHLEGTQQLSLLKSEHPELVQWVENFEKSIDGYKGSIPYANVDREEPDDLKKDSDYLIKFLSDSQTWLKANENQQDYNNKQKIHK